jgi:hypothetical protein
MSKNKFTNAFANALSKQNTIQSTDVQTSKHSNVQTSERPEFISKLTEKEVAKVDIKEVAKENIKVKKSTEQKSIMIPPTKKLSLKEQGWVPTTIYLPSITKQNLQLQSVQEGRDMSEIVAGLLG